MENTIEVRVHVPVARETEFYRWFADWRDGTVTSTQSAPAPEVPAAEGSAPADLDAATAWWRLLRPSERALWGLWIDASPRMLKADDIVKSLELKGPRDIPGILSWVKRKGQKVGFTVDWRFRNDPLDGSPIYGLEDAEYADVLRQARDNAETKP